MAVAKICWAFDYHQATTTSPSIMLTIAIKFYAYGILSNLLCLLGLFGNTLTLYILNSCKGKILLLQNWGNFSLQLSAQDWTTKTNAIRDKQMLIYNLEQRKSVITIKQFVQFEKWRSYYRIWCNEKTKAIDWIAEWHNCLSKKKVFLLIDQIEIYYIEELFWGDKNLSLYLWFNFGGSGSFNSSLSLIKWLEKRLLCN